MFRFSCCACYLKSSSNSRALSCQNSVPIVSVGVCVCIYILSNPEKGFCTSQPTNRKWHRPCAADCNATAESTSKSRRFAPDMAMEGRRRSAAADSSGLQDEVTRSRGRHLRGTRELQQHRSEHPLTISPLRILIHISWIINS